MKKTIQIISGIILLAFGLLTFFLSTSVIFDLFGIREKEGNYVLFIVWANFISSILYLLAAFGFFTKVEFTKQKQLVQCYLEFQSRYFLQLFLILPLQKLQKNKF